MGRDDKSPLKDLSVLVVEDEPLVAMALADELEWAQARVLGPLSTVPQTLEMLEQHTPDAAILDLDLHGMSVGPAADLLRARGIPFIFATGHDPENLPERYAQSPTCAKPAPASDVIAALAQVIRSSR